MHQIQIPKEEDAILQNGVSSNRSVLQWWHCWIGTAWNIQLDLESQKADLLFVWPELFRLSPNQLPLVMSNRNLELLIWFIHIIQCWQYIIDSFWFVQMHSTWLLFLTFPKHYEMSSLNKINIWNDRLNWWLKAIKQTNRIWLLFKRSFIRKERIFLCGLLETSESFDFPPFVGRISEFEIQITRGQWWSVFLQKRQFEEKKGLAKDKTPEKFHSGHPCRCCRQGKCAGKGFLSKQMM